MNQKINVANPLFLVDLLYVGCPRQAYVKMDNRDYSDYTFEHIGLLISDFLEDYPYPDCHVEGFTLVTEITDTSLDVIVESEYKPEW